MITKEKAIQILQASLPHIRNKYHVQRIGLFGSIAAGRNKEESDVDIVVEFSKQLGLEYFEMIEFLEKQFNQKVDVITSEGLNSIRNSNTKDSIMQSIIYV